LTLAAQSAAPTAKSKSPASAASSSIAPVVKDLPVRKVVLYKNGVGYFEHAGTVSGNQKVSIDFTSSQLNDVLQSLTVLDNGGGRIGGVNYNSTMPLADQLRTLALRLQDYPSTVAVYQAFRGQRVEVTGAGSPATGRLVNIEFRKETDKNGTTSEDHYYLILATDAGALRTVELSDSLSMRMTDPSLQKQLAYYLELVASGQNQQARHLTMDARGQGQRELQVSYISEVPVWKSTYRLVFPPTANGMATLQGWAVVDNTVGADWDNVQLSLVAGAPHSFIQPLSQPVYTHRPEIPIATQYQNAPQIHEAAESITADSSLHGVVAPASPQPRLLEQVVGAYSSATGEPKSLAGSTDRFVGTGSGNGYGVGSGGNIGGALMRPGAGVTRASDSFQSGDVSTNAFDDFFEYTLAQPVTIHKNESAMVPILQQNLPVEHVTLWSARDNTPLRAVWLENKSDLTLDAGSFSIFESGEFAGEGLLAPIHPGEKRLLSYAADQAVRVHPGGFASTRILHHIAMHQGVLVESSSSVTENTYTVTNAAPESRTVIVEHPRKPNATLDSEPKPTETTASAYRFRVEVKPHESVDLHVGERTTAEERISINPTDDRTAFLIAVTKYSPELEEKLKPLIAAEVALSDLNRKIDNIKAKETTLSDDEERDRNNLTALKGNDSGKRFVEELNRAEDDLQASRKERAGLEKDQEAARAKLQGLIAQLSFDSDLDVVLESNQSGDRRPR
jgi:hypothetical protein